jgi:hypothetical protein
LEILSRTYRGLDNAVDTEPYNIRIRLVAENDSADDGGDDDEDTKAEDNANFNFLSRVTFIPR